MYYAGRLTIPLHGSTYELEGIVCGKCRRGILQFVLMRDDDARCTANDRGRTWHFIPSRPLKTYFSRSQGYRVLLHSGAGQ